MVLSSVKVVDANENSRRVETTDWSAPVNIGLVGLG